MTVLRADEHYDVIRETTGWRRDQIRLLRCKKCGYSVNVIALHKTGDKSGAGRYCRARAKIVKHWHTTHAQNLITANPSDGTRGER